jgi:polar amino acid transport system substrate-binding protein
MKKTAILLLLSTALMLVGCNRVPNVISSPEHVGGTIIGGLTGTPSLRLADELGTAVAFESGAEMMLALRAGSIDCAIMERTTALELVSDTRGVRILTEPLVEYELRFAVPMENRGLLEAVNLALEELGRNGTLRGLINRYFSRGSFSYQPLEGADSRQSYLHIALSADNPPFSFRDDNGRLIGMDVEVAIAVSDILDIRLEVLEYDPWELVTAVWHGRADLALGWHPGEGEGIINTSEPYARAVQVVIVRR